MLSKIITIVTAATLFAALSQPSYGVVQEPGPRYTYQQAYEICSRAYHHDAQVAECMKNLCHTYGCSGPAAE